MIVRHHLRRYERPDELLRLVNDLDSRHVAIEILGVAVGLRDG